MDSHPALRHNLPVTLELYRPNWPLYDAVANRRSSSYPAGRAASEGATLVHNDALIRQIEAASDIKGT
jgi:hypothetical protein